MAGQERTGVIELKDPHGRCLNNLRLCITQRCNMDCFFCHREGESDSNDEMTASEISRIVANASELGFRKLKITGGEPLLRGDLDRVVSSASSRMGEVSLTTNGLLLEQAAPQLKRAGLDRINVSLHSLDRERFRRITNVDGLNRVIRGVETARELGLNPIKLNFVVLHGVNVDEVDDMLSFSAEMGVNLQLIEYMPLGKGANGEAYHAEMDRIEADLTSRADHVGFAHLNQRKRYTLECEGNVVHAEVVKPIENSLFCATCSRLRVTSDGKLKPCLLRSDNLVDLKPLLGGGNSDEEIKRAFAAAVSRREPYWK